jgi:putative addiction module killer protein
MLLTTVYSDHPPDRAVRSLVRGLARPAGGAPHTDAHRRLATGNPGQHRVLTGGVVEMKIDHGPGYRVYFTQRGTEIIVLLCGGDKRTQQADIKTALRLAAQL